MKKFIISVTTVFVLVFALGATVFANDNVDYEKLYMDFAKDADVNFYNPWYSSTRPKGLIMVDLKGDGVPVIIGYDTNHSVYDENGETIYPYDQRYKDPQYTHISHVFKFVFGIKDNEVVKFEGNGQHHMPMPYLPFEDAAEGNGYCGFAVDKNNVRSFVVHNPDRTMSRYQVLYPAYGDIIYKSIEAETFKTDYREADYPYAYVAVYDFEKLKSIPYEEAMKILLSNYKKLTEDYKEISSEADYKSSVWAEKEVEKADELGLIPDCLDGADLTQSITRAEFAAVSVKAYEVMANTTALPAVNNPFTDTTDTEVLKAYNAGITTGVSATEFRPNALLNREQAATMLTRVFKRATLDGWTIANDSQFTLNYTKPIPFADDSKISAWAKDSVYFMTANGIINGVGDNKFAPQNTTTEEQAKGYANATREQALLIAVRMVENLK